MRRSLVPAMGAYALWRMLTTFPSSASSGHPLSSARLHEAVDAAPHCRADRGLRSDVAPRRATPSRRPGCLSPSRHAEDVSREGIAPSGLRAGSPAHAAHTFSPGWGQCFCRALQGHRGGHPRFRDVSRVQVPLVLAGTSVPGPDDPSTPPSSTDPAVDEDDFLARTDADRSA
jgi:hypothetical protein